nr:hypothetical protein [Nitrosopumilus sp.]
MLVNRCEYLANDNYVSHLKIIEETDSKKFYKYPDEENIFYQTDLKIYCDDYQEELLLNEIKQKDFDEVVFLLESILEEKSIFKLNGSERFKKMVFDSIKKLCTREIGRDLFKKVNDKYQLLT